MLEIAVFTPSSATRLLHSGASRLELCASYTAGGTTPSLATLAQIRGHPGTATAHMAINVMIRPRGGDFVYSAAEFAQMRESIAAFREGGGVQGFVFGVLTGEGRVDGEKCVELVNAAGGLPCTFHRAVDEVVDWVEALECIVGCGFASVLTSGGAACAEEGVQRVAEMQKRFGGRISVILGGGVRSSNVVDLKARTGVQWVHSAAITEPGEEVDESEVRRMVALLEDV